MSKSSGNTLPFYAYTTRELVEDQDLISDLHALASVRQNPSLGFCFPELLDHYRSRFLLDRSSIQVQSTALLNLCVKFTQSPSTWSSSKVDKLTPQQIDSLFVDATTSPRSDAPIYNSRLSNPGLYHHPMEDDYQESRQKLLLSPPVREDSLKLNELQYLERLIQDAAPQVGRNCSPHLREVYNFLNHSISQEPNSTNFKADSYPALSQYRECVRGGVQKEHKKFEQ